MADQHPYAGGHMAREVGGTWLPKYPEYANDPGQRVGEIVPPETFSPKFRRLQWIPAPPTSHLLSFAHEDARALLTLKREDGSAMYRQPRELPLSVIHVKFKAKGKAPVTQYAYSSASHDMLARYFELLKSAEHPGAVLHAHLERNPAVSYHQVAVMA